MNIRLTARVSITAFGFYIAKCETDAEIMLNYPTMPEDIAQIIEQENYFDIWEIVGSLRQAEDGYYIMVSSMRLEDR